MTVRGSRHGHASLWSIFPEQEDKKLVKAPKLTFGRDLASETVEFSRPCSGLGLFNTRP